MHDLLRRADPLGSVESAVTLRRAASHHPSCFRLSVVCGPVQPDPEDGCAIVNPVLIVEVLSDGTEAYDRGEKAAHYRHLPSLHEYVLVSQHRPRIEVYRRNDAGRWELYEYESGAQVDLGAVGCAISVDEVYRDPLAAGATAS